MATRLTLPREQVLSDAGQPLPGAKLYTYAAGTSTPKATYTDAALTTANTNPLVADAAGRFGDVFLASGSYKMTLQTAAGVQVWAADPVDGAIEINTGVITTTENLLINGDFRINQRFATTSFANDEYCHDRWYTLTSSGNVTVGQQLLQAPGQVNNVRLTQPDATSKRVGLAQIVELMDAGALRGQPVAMGASVRCSVAQPVRYAILEWTGVADSVTSDVVNDWASTSYTAGGFFKSTTMVVVATGTITPTANVWTTLPTITGTVSQSCTNLIAVVWSANVLVQNATLDIGLVRLVSGTAANTFPTRPYADELAMCQRYYETGENYIASYNASGGSFTISNTAYFKATKRATPTMAVTGAIAQSGTTATAFVNVGLSGAERTITANAGGWYSHVTWKASAEL